MRGQVDEGERNALSVRLELQADCFAGLWAHQANEAQQILERGDVESGIAAAAAVGDDNLQRRSQGGGRARILHPWWFGTAGAMVPTRPRVGTA